MLNIRKSQITPLYTTQNALGSFAGAPQPNLQIDDLEPGEYTLQFQIVQPTIDGVLNGGRRGNPGSAAYAIVNWKIQGQQIRRVISVFNGTVLAGVAEAVDVSILDQSERTTSWSTIFGGITAAIVPVLPPAVQTVTFTQPVFFAGDELISFASQPNTFYAIAGPVNNVLVAQLATPYTGPAAPATDFFVNAPYKVGVALSKGTRSPIMQPPVLVTSPVLNIPHYSAGPPVIPGNLVLPIPEDAGIISILTTVSVNGGPPVPTSQAQAAEGVVTFLKPTGVVVAAGRYIPQQFPLWYPVPPDSNILLLENNSTTQALLFSYQWGIEG